MKMLNLDGLKRIIDTLRRQFTTDTLNTREIYTTVLSADTVDTPRARLDCISSYSDDPIVIRFPGALILEDEYSGAKCTLKLGTDGSLKVNDRTVSTTIGIKG